jgi:hypothetical protein
MQACLGVAGGMLTLGGIRTHDRTAIHEIWMLKNETSKWDVIGKISPQSKILRFKLMEKYSFGVAIEYIYTP